MNWIDYRLNQEHCEALIREAQIAREMAEHHRPIKSLAWLGGQMIRFGAVLQARFGTREALVRSGHQAVVKSW